MSRHLVSAILTATALAACGGEDTAGPDPDDEALPPAAVADLSGSDLTGTVGEELPTPLRVRVTDSTGAPVSGVAVDFQVATGGGQVTEIPTTQSSAGASFSRVAVVDSTDANGEAQARWTLGTTAGEQRVTVLVPGVPTINITAVAGPDAAAALEFDFETSAIAGRPDRAPDGPLVVLVEDQYGNAVPGAEVEWAALDGGTVASSTTATDDGGLAEVAVALGPDVGLQLFTAALADLQTDTIGVFVVTGSTDAVDAGGGPAGTTPPDARFVGGVAVDNILVLHVAFEDGVAPTPATGSAPPNAVVGRFEFDLDRDTTTGSYSVRRCGEIDSLFIGVDGFVDANPRSDLLQFFPDAPAGAVVVARVDSARTNRCEFDGSGTLTIPIIRGNTMTIGVDLQLVAAVGDVELATLVGIPIDSVTGITDFVPDSGATTVNFAPPSPALVRPRTRSLAELTGLRLLERVASPTVRLRFETQRRPGR